MLAPLNIASIVIIAYNQVCCNHCRFCSVGKKRFDDISFSQFVKVMERFLEWKERGGRIPVFAPAIQHTHALLSYEQSQKFLELCARGNCTPLPLQMNGCIFMPQDDMYSLLERHRRAGYDRLSLTFCGNRSVHDLWAGRRGEFDFLLKIARITAQLGYHRQEQIFLSKSSIPVLDELLDQLDELPGEHTRSIYPFNYIGFAQKLENERINSDDLLSVPDKAKPYIELIDGIHNEPYRSESEWIDWVKKNYDNDAPRDRFLGITLSEESLPQLLSEDCDKIYDDYYTRFNNVYQQIPEITELADRFGDHDNDKLYALYELERKWVEAYVTKHLADFEEDYRISDF